MDVKTQSSLFWRATGTRKVNVTHGRASRGKVKKGENMSFVDEWIKRLPGNVGPLPGAFEEAVCLQGAEEGMVLLKNDGVLPLRDKTVALFGAGAVDTIIGGTGSGSTEPPYKINVEEGLRESGYELTSESWLEKFVRDSREANEAMEIDDFTRLWGGITVLIDEPEITSAELAEAKKAETAVYVIRRNTGEGCDRKNEKGDYLLSDMEYENLSKIAANFKHTVVVLNTSVMDPGFTEEIPGIGAVILMNLPGMMAGKALANILSGMANPSGRLTDTWAESYGDYATSQIFSANDGITDEEDYLEDIYVGYRYFDSFGIAPHWCFGYGLSYTEFSMEPTAVTADAENVTISVRVKNTGEYPGKEVVQVYVSAPISERLTKPYQELRGFAKTKVLSPGEEETVVIRFATASMASFDEKSSSYILEKGCYRLRVGKNSRETEVAAVLELDGDVMTEKLSKKAACSKKLDFYKAPAIVYETAQASVIFLKAGDFHTVDHSDVGSKYTVTYVPEGMDYQPYMDKNPYKLKYETKEHVVTVRNVPDATFPDVADGKVTMEEFVASLDPEVLLRLVTGVSHETPWSVANRMKKKAAALDAIASSGRTTAQYVKTLGIPNSYLSDGPAGLRIIGKPTAAWPVGTVLAQTWNTELMEQTGDGFGTEMEAYHHSVILGPGMNIHRDPMCGRSFEYYTEDPLLNGKMAAAFTRGVQSHEGCFVAIKHFACNSQETDRGISSSNVSERALREIYLKGFEIAVKEADAGTIMTSYNKVNGVHSSENRELLEGIVRGEWGFKGMFMTDWHSQSYKPADIHAGNDLIMGGIQVEAIAQALWGWEPVFNSDGSIKERTVISYDGLKQETVGEWGAFLPCADGTDTCKAAVLAGTQPGERVRAYVENGIALVSENTDGSSVVTYKGIRRGRHLALGDLQRCAIHVLEYLLRSSAWKEIRKNMEEK